MAAKISDRRGEWFSIWEEDRRWIENIMIQNMQDDLNAGYDYFGKAIIEQREMIDEYHKETMNTYEMFKTMQDNEVDRWCFYDLKKRGAID